MAPLRVGHMGFAPCLDTPLHRSAAAAMASPRCGTSPVLCRGINGLCRSVAVTCCAPLIMFIDHCYGALYIIYNISIPARHPSYVPGHKRTDRAPSPLLIFICCFVVVTTRRTDAKMYRCRSKVAQKCLQ